MSQTQSFVLTNKQKLGGLLNAEERELAYLRAQPNRNENAITLSERKVQHLKDQLAMFVKE